jgi:hypothetical protein
MVANRCAAPSGTRSGYHHAFSANTINWIVREVLHIYKGSGGLAFRMSYLPGTRGRSDVVMEFRGTVEAARPSVVLVGHTTGAGVEWRLRTFYARNNGHIEQPELQNYKAWPAGQHQGGRRGAVCRLHPADQGAAPPGGRGGVERLHEGGDTHRHLRQNHRARFPERRLGAVAAVSRQPPLPVA